MISFLHISDVHLGTNQYNSPDETRKRDFFETFYDVVKRYAIDEKVDFVLICGDLFDKNRLDPDTLNQSIVVFNELKRHNIPVILIEGNHDNQWSRETVSWLNFLGDHGYAVFLKPVFEDGRLKFSNYSDDIRTGNCYIFNEQVRIIGLQWFGANTASLVPQIADQISFLGKYPYTILMMHAGLEGYLAGYGTLSAASIEPLKPFVDYLALGHIHMYYNYDNWAYNAGSLEACAFPEFFDPHGALLVRIDKNNNTQTQLMTDYKKRKFLRIQFDVTLCVDADDAFTRICNRIDLLNDESIHNPLVELVIDGSLSFNRSDINVSALKQYVKNTLNPLVVLVKNYARPKEYVIESNYSLKNTRKEIELKVLQDLISQNPQYLGNKEEIAGTMIALKNMVLENQPPDKILLYLQNSLLDKK